jgi:hypothetical protein
MCIPTLLAALPTMFGGAAAAGTAAAPIFTLAGGFAAPAAATAATAGMTAAQAISLGTTLAGGALSAVGAINQASVARQVAANNAKMAEWAAQDAQRRGENEADSIRRKGASLKSTQRAVMAGKGLDISYGTAADIQDQTDFFTQSDIATTRTNARREAWNLRAQGQQALAMGKADSLNSMLAAGGSLLGTAGTVAGKWDLYRRGGSGINYEY